MGVEPPTERAPLPLREVTVEELRALRAESEELCRELYEQFRPILTIGPEELNLRLR